MALGLGVQFSALDAEMCGRREGGRDVGGVNAAGLFGRYLFSSLKGLRDLRVIR